MNDNDTLKPRATGCGVTAGQSIDGPVYYDSPFHATAPSAIADMRALQADIKILRDELCKAHCEIGRLQVELADAMVKIHQLTPDTDAAASARWANWQSRGTPNNE